jgi:hypothetical protein
VPGQEVCKFIVTDAFSGNNTPVQVNVTNSDPCIEINVTNILGTIGDIRGVYFNLRTNGFDTSNIDDTEIDIISWVNRGNTEVVSTTTVFQCSDNGNFSLISESAQMKGGGAGGDGGREYTCGVEVRQSVFDDVFIVR